MDAKKRVAKAPRPLSTFEVTLQVQSGITEKEANLMSQPNDIQMEDKHKQTDVMNAAEAESTETEDGSYSGDDLIETIDSLPIDTFEPEPNEKPEIATKDVVDEIEPLTTPLSYAEDVPESYTIEQTKNTDETVNLPDSTDKPASDCTDGNDQCSTDAILDESSADQSVEAKLNTVDQDEPKCQHEETLLETAEKIAQAAIHDAILFIEESPKVNVDIPENENMDNVDSKDGETFQESEISKRSSRELTDNLPPAPTAMELQDTVDSAEQPLVLPSPPHDDEHGSHQDFPAPPSLNESGEVSLQVPPPSLTISPPDEYPTPPEDSSTDQLPSPPPSADLKHSLEEDLPSPPPVEQDAEEHEVFPPPPPPDEHDAQETTYTVEKQKKDEADENETHEVDSESGKLLQKDSNDVESQAYVETQNPAVEGSTSQNGKSSASEPEVPSEKNADAGTDEQSTSKVPASETQPLRPDNAPGTSRGEEALKPATNEKAKKSCCSLM